MEFFILQKKQIPIPENFQSWTSGDVLCPTDIRSLFSIDDDLISL